MKNSIFIILILSIFFSNIFAQNVIFDSNRQTLSMKNVYIKNHPEATCYNVVLKLVSDSRYPYGIALQIDLKNTYDTHKKCSIEKDNAFYDPISSNLIIPEFSINNKIYAINLRFDTVNLLFYIKGIVPVTQNENKEELLGYCYYNKDEIHEFCWEYYYKQGVQDKESIKETAEKGCKGMNSTLIEGQHCPIYNNYTYKCKQYFENALILVSYDLEYNVSSNFLPYKDAFKNACESYHNGEFYSNY